MGRPRKWMALERAAHTPPSRLRARRVGGRRGGVEGGRAGGAGPAAGADLGTSSRHPAWPPRADVDEGSASPRRRAGEPVLRRRRGSGHTFPRWPSGFGGRRRDRPPATPRARRRRDFCPAERLRAREGLGPGPCAGRGALRGAGGGAAREKRGAGGRPTVPRPQQVSKARASGREETWAREVGKPASYPRHKRWLGSYGGAEPGRPGDSDCLIKTQPCAACAGTQGDFCSVLRQ